MMQVLINGRDLIEGIEVFVVTPGIGKGLLLCRGIFEVDAFKQDVVVALAVERRVDIDEVNEPFAIMLAVEFEEYVEAIAEVEVVHYFN